MSKSIIDYLKEWSDPLGAQGSHDNLWQILLIIIMGIKIKSIALKPCLQSYAFFSFLGYQCN
jgi:hypothetical protein